MSDLFAILVKIRTYYEVEDDPKKDDYAFVIDRMTLDMDFDMSDIDDEIKEVIQQYNEGKYPDVLKRLEESHPERAKVINYLSSVPGIGPGMANNAYDNGWYTLKDLMDAPEVSDMVKKFIFWRAHLASPITDEDFAAITARLDELLVPHNLGFYSSTMNKNWSLAPTFSNFVGKAHSVFRINSRQTGRDAIKLYISTDDLPIPSMRMTVASKSTEEIVDILKPVLPEIFQDIQTISALIQVAPETYPAHEITIHVYPKSLYDDVMARGVE